jgi:DNA polymerase
VRVESSPWGDRPKLYYEGMNQQTRKWGFETTYGGKLAENVTQAVARDLMAESMIELERRGYRNILTIHDEAVLEAPIGFGSLAEVIDVMKSPPDWAIGCPIGAAGFEADRYRKD